MKSWNWTADTLFIVTIYWPRYSGWKHSLVKTYYRCENTYITAFFCGDGGHLCVSDESIAATTSVQYKTEHSKINRYSFQ